MDKEKCKNPNCKNDLVHTEGRRKKKYCSAKCKNFVSMKTFLAKPKEKKRICISVEKYNGLLAKISENNKIENKEKILKERGVVGATAKNVRQYPLTESEMIPRLNGESSLEYRIRCNELKNK